MKQPLTCPASQHACASIPRYCDLSSILSKLAPENCTNDDLRSKPKRVADLGRLGAVVFFFPWCDFKKIHTLRHTHTPPRARTAILINRSLSRPWIFALTLVDAVTSLQQMHLAPNHQHSDNVIRQLILACGGPWCRCFFQQPGSVLSLPFSERLQEITCETAFLITDYPLFTQFFLLCTNLNLPSATRSSIQFQSNPNIGHIQLENHLSETCLVW